MGPDGFQHVLDLEAQKKKLQQGGDQSKLVIPCMQKHSYN